MLQKLISELESVGVGFATVHTQHESILTRKIGVRSLPHFVSLVDGNVRPFRDDDVSLSSLIDFIKRALPKNLITDVNDLNYVNFLSGWSDNKVRVLFVNEDKLIRLRYYLVAFYFRERIAFGHVFADKNSKEIQNRYHIDPKMSSMLIFNEDISRSLATLSVSDLKTQLMKDVLDSNKYLFLPRITSQVLFVYCKFFKIFHLFVLFKPMFDQICPTGSRFKLCIMLVTSDTVTNEPKFEEMRNFIRENNFSKDLYRFMYIFREKQTDFVRAISVGFKKGNINRGIHIVIFWRRETDRIYYEWLDNEWDLINSNYINETRNKLSNLLNQLIQNAHFNNNAKISSLVDETAKGLISRIMKRLLLVTENLSDNIVRTDPTPVLSFIVTLGIIIFIGYLMTFFM